MTSPRLSSAVGALSAALAAQGISPAVREVVKAHATRKLEGRRKWRGLNLSIENDVGSVRRGIDPDGRPWETKMSAAYSYIKGSEGVDGDHLDAFLVSSNEDVDNVYVVHTTKPGTLLYDEDKAFLGCGSADEAIRCFNAHYDQPERHFGAVTAIPVEKFVEHCKGGKANWGKPLAQRIGQKIHLTRKAMRRAEKALADHIEWMRGVVANESRPDEDVEKAILESPEYREIEKSLWAANDALSQAQLEIVVDPAYAGRRILRVAPHIEAVDLAHEITPLDILRASWPYYEACGNFDLEHATKSVSDNLDEMIDGLRKRGLAPKINNGKISYEIGKPVPGSFNPDDGSYLVEIYSGTSDFAEAANWFWDSIDPEKTQPPVPWKTSIAGAAAYVDVVVNNRDSRLGLDIKNMKAERMTYFRWSNTAATLEPVNHWSPPVQVVSSRSVYRSTEKGLIPMNETYTVKDAVLDAARQGAEIAVENLYLSGQISSADRHAVLLEVEKALVGMEGDQALTREVSKALEYGAVSTDAATLAGGAAAVRESLEPLSEYRKKKLVDELKRDTEKGLTPFQSGYEWGEDPLVDVADFVNTEMGVYDADDALDIAEGFFLAIVGQ